MKNLEEKLREVLEKLSKSGITENFYLAGGTALFFRYHHRISEDLDFFLFPDRTVDFNLIAGNLGKLGQIIDLKVDTVLSIINGIRAAFFKYPYPLIDSVEELEGVFAAGDADIACMKSIAIIQRGEKKDFYDLWFLMKEHDWSIDDLIEMCSKKYGSYFNPGIFLKALIYFKDAEDARIPDVDAEWENIKGFFIHKVMEKLGKEPGN